MDSFATRFNVLVLHVWMCLVRLRAEGKTGQSVSQVLFDNMIEDMEDKLGEQGVRARRGHTAAQPRPLPGGVLVRDIGRPPCCCQRAVPE